MRDSVPIGSYSSVCNVLRQWKSRSSLLIESTDSMIYIAKFVPLNRQGGRFARNKTYKRNLLHRLNEVTNTKPPSFVELAPRLCIVPIH